MAWVRRAAARGGPRRQELRLGIGDDAALLHPRRGQQVVLTTDLMVEGVHFLRARDAPAVVGRRLATRALSDLAAMGAEPLALLVSSAYPDKLAAAWPRGLYRGLLAAAHAAGARLAGGDVSSSPGGIVLDVVGVGQVPAGRALRRDGARPGDRIYVSGTLGEAASGRELAHSGRVPRTAAERRARRRHQHPRARWELGQALRGIASAAMDLSDGLATDLHHLCRESRVGAVIEAGSLPVPPGADHLRRALFGGEDYELLFTVPPKRRLPAAAAGAHEIGEVLAGRRVWLQPASGARRPLPDRGWQHWN